MEKLQIPTANNLLSSIEENRREATEYLLDKAIEIYEEKLAEEIQMMIDQAKTSTSFDANNSRLVDFEKMFRESVIWLINPKPGKKSGIRIETKNNMSNINDKNQIFISFSELHYGPNDSWDPIRSEVFVNDFEKSFRKYQKFLKKSGYYLLDLSDPSNNVFKIHLFVKKPEWYGTTNCSHGLDVLPKGCED